MLRLIINKAKNKYVIMKKISLLILILLFAVAASGGYGYYTFVLSDEDEDDDINDTVGSSGNAPTARITPSNPKIQINETISFSASESTDIDGDDLTFFWAFEGDSKEYEGEAIDRNFPDKGEYTVNLIVRDSTGLSNEAETVVSVVENYHEEKSGNVDGNDNTDNTEIPVEAGFLSLDIDYSLESANFNPVEESQVTLRLTDPEGEVIQEENGVGESSGTWSYSTEDLGSTGNYVFTIESESGSMDFDIVIDVTY